MRVSTTDDLGAEPIELCVLSGTIAVTVKFVPISEATLDPARAAAVDRCGLLAPGAAEALNRLAMLACRAAHAAGAAISVSRADGYQLVGAHGDHPRRAVAVEECLEAESRPVRGAFVLSRAPGCAAVAMIDGDGQVIGWLTVEGQPERRWQPQELELLEGFAELAVGHGRLVVAEESAARSEAARVRSERRASAAIADAERAICRLDEVQALAAIGSWEWDPARDRLMLSAELCRMVGVGARREPRTLTQADYEAWFPMGQRREFLDTLEAALKPDGTWEAEHTLVLADGSSRVMISRGKARARRGGGTDFITGTLQDVTAVREQEARLQAVFAEAPIGVAVLGLIGSERGRWTAANPALERLLGADRNELDGALSTDYTHPADLERSSLELGRLAAAEVDRVSFEQRLRRSDSEWVWTACSAALIRAADGSPRHAIAHYLDIGDRKRCDRELEHLTHRDPLTALVKRGRLEEELDRALAHAARYGSSGALVVFDLDGFEQLNKAAGRASTDAVLIAIAHAVGAAVRASDTFARTGADNFAILLPSATIGQARHVADKVLRIVRRRAHLGIEPPVSPLTASVGVVAWGERIPSGSTQVLVEADSALYEAQSAGGDRYVVYALNEGDDPEGL